MTGPRRLSKRDQARLVQLADGVLAGAARGRAEALPDAARLVDRQRRVARALGAGDPRPVPALRARELLPRLLPAGAIAACLVLLALVMPDGERSTVERAADLAQVSATRPAPAASGETLRAEVDGVKFPDWAREFGWNAIGRRDDMLDGRATTTVYYEHTGHRVAYTIVSGPALERPDGGRVVVRDGLAIALYRDPAHGGHDIAVFERNGRTCVIAGHVMKLDTLIKLAAWKGDGRIRS